MSSILKWEIKVLVKNLALTFVQVSKMISEFLLSQYTFPVKLLLLKENWLKFSCDMQAGRCNNIFWLKTKVFEILKKFVVIIALLV